jgi:hypothetical protein
MSSDDFKAAFRAATSGRQSGKLVSDLHSSIFWHRRKIAFLLLDLTPARNLNARCLRSWPQTKEQLRSLKAQKAAALAQQAEDAALGRTRSTDEDARSMPPPPPRVSAAAAKAQPDASYHADSQATRLNGGGAVAGPALQSEPSVNNRGGRALGTSPDAANAQSAAGSSGLPAGFFEASVVGEAAVGSEGGGSLPGSSAAALSAGARSVEGSTGGGEDGGRATTAADLATSAVSPPPKPRAATSAVFPIREEMEEHDRLDPVAPLDLGSAPTPHAAAGAESAAPGGAALPAGFFSDAAADAEARGVAPKRKAPAELDKEMATFLREVEADGAAAAAAAAAADEDDVDARRDREDFEHL